MKTFAAMMAVVLGAFSAQAQVSLELVTDQDYFLPNEAVPLTVNISNRSGQPLHLGEDSSWLTFNVESLEGGVVSKNSEVPVKGAFDLASSQMGVIRVDLQPHFAIAKPGRYKVTATMRIKEWNATATSRTKLFSVFNGTRLWSQDFGVASGTNAPPEARRYTLLKANNINSQLRLYVQVSDPSEARVFKVASLGQMVSFNKPDAKLDLNSNLHVLCQSGAQIFSHSVVAPDGTILKQEVYDGFSSRPRLSPVGNTGQISVSGGTLRLNPETVPVVLSPNELGTPRPAAATNAPVAPPKPKTPKPKAATSPREN